MDLAIVTIGHLDHVFNAVYVNQFVAFESIEIFLFKIYIEIIILYGCFIPSPLAGSYFVALFRFCISIFDNTSFVQGSLMRVQYPKCMYGP